MVDSPVAVLGAGSWGTALAIALARNEQPVKLWGPYPDIMKEMQQTRCNTKYIPEVVFPELIYATADLAEALANVQDILIVVPSDAFASVVSKISPYLNANTRIAWASKGFAESGQFLHEVITDLLPISHPLAVMSGPTFAKEVALGLPAALTVASNDHQLAQDWMNRLHQRTLRPYLSDDLVGVQLGGAVKNPLAIAAGVSDGLGYGNNARCALITRALVEMKRLGTCLGANPDTLDGLSGLGDLILTCTGNLSRNRRFGFSLGQGKNPEDAAKEIGQVVEGKHNAFLVAKLAQKHQIEMPIIEQVCCIIDGTCTAKDAVNELLMREPREE